MVVTLGDSITEGAGSSINVGNGNLTILTDAPATRLCLADGRATGARAMLRLRDVAAYKRDLVQLSDQHRRLTGDLAASREGRVHDDARTPEPASS